VRTDGEICRQRGTDEERAKWIGDSKPGEEQRKCVRGLYWPRMQTKSKK
jgi:hypothetical protein